MSFHAESAAATPESEIDRKVGIVKDKADEFARLSVGEKARLLGELIPGVHAVSDDWIAAACKAKGIDPSSSTSGEEWLAGPSITIRNARLLQRSLLAVEKDGRPPLGRKSHVASDGRLEVDIFPGDTMDAALFGGFTGKVLLQPGIDEKRAKEMQAPFFHKKDPKGEVSLILGAGNVSAIPPTDALYKMFVEGKTCVLKMNPVNEYVGPMLERAFKPLIDKGYLSVVYGDGAIGKYLVDHSSVGDVHITGSDKTHDLIVWGPPGPERERRKAANDPILKKTITSELGNVSPVVIVPADYSDEELWFMARNVATMVGNNGSFNCNAAKILVTAAGWKQGEKFQGLVKKALAAVPLRKAYYPGAFERYLKLTEGRRTEKIGTPGDGQLAWTIIPGVDSSKADEPLFTVEPFCGILSETTLPESEPAEFLAAAASFCNDKLWGTLNACILIHPKHEADSSIARALDKAIRDLRYGTVGINHWPALGFGFVTPPWGGHPSATLANVQSGIGWVHNTFLIEGIEKSVIRGPLVSKPKPPWFCDNKMTHVLGKKTVEFEANPSWFKVPSMAIAAFKG